MTQPIQPLPSAADLLERCEDFICVLGDDAVITRINPSFERELGRSAKDLIGEPLTTLVAPADRAVLSAALTEAMQTGTSRSAVCAMAAGAGDTRAIDWLLSPWSHDMVLAIGRDITERTAMGRRLEAMLVAVPDIVAELDRDGRCLAIHGTSGASPLELGVGEPVHKHLPEELAGAVGAALEAALASGELQRCLYQERGPDARREWDCRITPLGDGVLALFRDVTSDRIAERDLLANLRDLDDSAQSIAHDLREPLDNMRHLMGLLAPLAPAPVSEQSDKYLGQMERGLDRMDGLLRGLRRYVRIGARWPAPRPVSLAAVIESAVARVRRRRARLIEVSTHIETGADELITVGRALETCLAELIDNAVFHHDGDRCHIDIRIVARPGARRVEVVDDGPGVDDELLPQIFGLFASFGADSTGLGLAVVRRILALCRGDIEITSPVYDRRGTAAILSWPEVWPRAGAVR